MCGRFDTSHLTWADIHAHLSGFGLPLKTGPLNLQASDDVRPTTPQLTARLDGDGWIVEKMRWGLIPFWRNGKPIKDTEKGKGDGFKLTTFNARVETCAGASTFKGACLYALQATTPHLTRSALHRCFQRHGISRLPEIEGDKPAKQPFKRYPLGYFHIDIAEVRTGEGKIYLFVAVDRTSKYAFARLKTKATTLTAREFLDELVAAVPYQIHTVLTDNGIQFADLPKNRDGFTAKWRGHPFDRCCLEHGIEHRLTKPNHPWTNGQVERMNRTLKEATVRRYHYDNHQQLEDHIAAFLDAYNFARRLKTLRGLTPYEAISKAWADEPNASGSTPST